MVRNNNAAFHRTFIYFGYSNKTKDKVNKTKRQFCKKCCKDVREDVGYSDAFLSNIQFFIVQIIFL